MNTPIAHTVDRTLETLESWDRRTLPSESLPSPTAKMKNPANTPKRDGPKCSSPWQQKNLGLLCFHPIIQQMADEAERFAAGWFRGSVTHRRLLVLAGKPGTGKTMTAKGVHRWAERIAFQVPVMRWPRIPTVEYALWPEIAANLSTRESAAAVSGKLDDMTAADLLILDDLGAEHDPWKLVAARLCTLLTQRSNRWTMVTTNIEPDQWSEQFDNRIADRLLRDSTVVVIPDDCPSFTEI
ncbi:MAG TPA: ATP-binding protein [Candidatus Paceibacterota bacterium]|nr:ATP-binding protein [Candidatus Paceibacterota bacterium]